MHVLVTSPFLFVSLAKSFWQPQEGPSYEIESLAHQPSKRE